MASPVSQDELDEEQARRSIVVSSIPENLTDKDIIIHFQRTKNGGGEVDSGRYLDPTDTSVVVVTFEQPETVESAINKQQIIDGAQVKVQRYPAPVTIPEVFVEVQAMVDPYIFNSSHLGIDALQFLRDEFGVHLRHSNSRNVDYLIGSLTQIELCHRYLVEQLTTPPENNEPPTRTTSRDNDAIHDNSKEVINKSINLQTVPILLTFIFSVPKYSQQLQDIETRYKVKISGENDEKNVKIESRPDCIQKQFEEGCEKFINLYQKVHGGPMLSKELVLQPGSGSDYRSVDEAVNEILEDAPVVIDKLSTKDTWQFYGEENDVKSAINDVCKLLCISNPMKKSSRKRAPETSQNPKGGAKSYDQDIFKGKNHEELPRPQDLAHSQAPRSVDNTFALSSSNVLKEVFVTKKGFKLTVQKSDITKEQADVIVSCNDEYLTWFNHGLAKSIIDKAGQDVFCEASAQKKKKKPGDIIITNAGKLLCHKIMHIILWNGKISKDVEKNIVHDSVFDCLKKVQSKKLKSIAFPVVGANQKTGMELKNCACAMVIAVEKYMGESIPQKNAVSDIRFILIDPAAFEVFKVELTKRYGDCRVMYPNTNPQPRTDDTGSSNSSAGRQGYERKKTHDNDKKDDKDECAICLEKPSDPRTLSKCKHQFCKSCIEKRFTHSNQCPTCGMAYGVQKGNMPNGNMYDRTKYYMHLPGYERYGTIEINYHFPNGTQGPEHPHPGQWYSGTSHTAYLPDCSEGREILGLLKKAFDARLTFTIGTSVTIGQQNTVTWNDIHHKTSQYGGATGFGYPDPGYLKRVKKELAAKGIS